MTIPEAPPKEDQTTVVPATEDDSRRFIARSPAVGGVPSPPLPPKSHPRPSARRRSPAQFALLGLLILVLTVVVVLMVSRFAAPTSAPTAVPARSTVVSIRTT